MKKILTSVLLLTTLIHSQSSLEWVTHFEKSNFLETPRYTETMKYFQKLANFSEFAVFDSFGISPQERNLNYLIVSKDKVFDPVEVKKTGKPVLLIINGIHSGEIEGKDACMLLLKDILATKEKINLTDNIVILVVPIFNVDGHERMSPYNRINQNGPKEMGWRTTSQNKNLNRDWMKADAPEMQAMLKLFYSWLPDFIIDSHSTDGADYQYTITYGVEKFGNIYSGTAEWLTEEFIPSIEDGVNNKGFLVHPYVYLKEWRKGLDAGIVDWAATPRFSTGYAALQNRPSLLIETHMTKPYKDRVYSTKAMIETTLEFLNLNHQQLIELNKEADEKSIEELTVKKQYLPLTFNNTDKFEEINFKGYNYYWDSSTVSGTNKLVYNNEKKDFKLKYYNDVIVTDSVLLPDGYLIPKEWEYLVEILKLHGIQVEVLTADTMLDVTKYHFNNVEFSNSSYEGRPQVKFNYMSFTKNQAVSSGTFYVPTNQRTVRVIANLLEPKADDSFIKWGFMNSIFERTEYFENYVMEKIAVKMLEDNAELKKEFESKLIEDEEFRNDADARLNYFYSKSPYYDKNFNVYPIVRAE